MKTMIGFKKRVKGKRVGGGYMCHFSLFLSLFLGFYSNNISVLKGSQGGAEASSGNAEGQGGQGG
jgi:hypothetical protein